MSSRSTLPLRPAPGPLCGPGAGSRQALRILSFGWELAPILSGGLGVACAGLARALAGHGVELTFVLPKLPRPVRPDGFVVRDARDAVPDHSHDAQVSVRAHDPGKCFAIDTLLTPYQDATSYDDALAAEDGRAYRAGDSADARRFAAAAASASLYGGNLLAEVDRLAHAAASIAAESPHDVIHCHDWMTFEAGVAAREISGKPLVLHVHSTERDRGGGGDGNATIRERERRGLEAADLVVAVSDFTRQTILEQYPGVEATRVRVVHNGIEPLSNDEAAIEPPPLASRRPVVLFLGRLTAQKGPEWFLRAAALVHRMRPDALFVVAGSGELLPWMVERAAELGLAASVLFTGFLSGADIARAYSMADVFVMPSVSEPFGLVPVEAMQRGTPAIVSRQSGVSEVIRHCLKVDFWDTDDLADKIVGVLDHAGLAESLSHAGRREAARLGWERPARRLLELFAEATRSPQESKP